MRNGIGEARDSGSAHCTVERGLWTRVGSVAKSDNASGHACHASLRQGGRRAVICLCGETGTGTPQRHVESCLWQQAATGQNLSVVPVLASRITWPSDRPLR